MKKRTRENDTHAHIHTHTHTHLSSLSLIFAADDRPDLFDPALGHAGRLGRELALVSSAVQYQKCLIIYFLCWVFILHPAITQGNLFHFHLLKGRGSVQQEMLLFYIVQKEKLPTQQWRTFSKSDTATESHIFLSLSLSQPNLLALGL